MDLRSKVEKCDWCASEMGRLGAGDGSGWDECCGAQGVGVQSGVESGGLRRAAGLRA